METKVTKLSELNVAALAGDVGRPGARRHADGDHGHVCREPEDTTRALVALITFAAGPWAPQGQPARRPAPGAGGDAMNVTKVHQCVYHRNGVSGEGFWAVIFDAEEHRAHEDLGSRRFIATVFDDDVEAWKERRLVNPHCAVFDIGMLAEVGVTFGHNSWRGDHFFAPLCEVITGTDWFAVNREGSTL